MNQDLRLQIALLEILESTELLLWEDDLSQRLDCSPELLMATIHRLHHDQYLDILNKGEPPGVIQRNLIATNAGLNYLNVVRQTQRRRPLGFQIRESRS